MRPAVFIVGPASHTRHIAELLLVAVDVDVEVVDVPDQSTLMVSEPLTLTFSANCNYLDDVKLGYQIEEEPPDNMEAVLAGIRELRDWMENKIRSVVKAMDRSRRQHGLPIFQPCWSARRWRSVT